MDLGDYATLRCQGDMKAVGLSTWVVLLLGLGLAAYAIERVRSREIEWEMQNPQNDPPDAREQTEYSFARLRYRSRGGYRGGSWGTDSNKAERQFLQGVRRLTRIHTRSVEEIVDVDGDQMYDWPWIYAVEVGHWDVNPSQAKRLRDYLDRGGFLM